MARRTKISEIAELEPNELIMLVQGTLTKIYPVNTGTNAKGPWSIQKGEIKDDTGTIKVMFNDRDHPIPDTWKGREITIEAVKGERSFSGVYAYDDTYIPKGKPQDTPPTRTLKVTKTGEVYLSDEGAGQQDDRPAQQPRQQAPAPQQAQPPRQQQQAPPAQHNGNAPAPADDPLPGIKRALARDAAFMALCVEAVGKLVLPAMVTVCQGATEETVQKFATTLFLNADRRGDTNRFPVPKKPRTEQAPAPQPDPEPEPPAPAPKPQARQAYRPVSDDDDDIPF